MSTKKTKKQPLRPLSPGHRACAGCGQLIAARTVAETLGPNVIISNATGCLEVTTTPYPESAWGLPWIHSLFENASSVASGIVAAQKAKNKSLKAIKVVAQGGDGGTFDIGFGQISGMWERGDNVLYICYDTEAYSNTGVQASGATPYAAHTTTTPSGQCLSEEGEKNYCSPFDGIGSSQKKKDMIAVALAHGLKYVAQTTAGFPLDIIEKIKKAMVIDGPSYIQILSPCVPGWKYESSQTMKIARLAAQTGFYPIVEYTEGSLSKVMKTPNPPKIEEYLKLQGRFAHLFKNARGKKEIENLQKIADDNIKKLGLK